MISFASDNNSGVHPSVFAAIQQANEHHALAYGEDKWTEQADATIRRAFGRPDIEPYYVFNGTGANMLALQAITRPFNSIICATTGHINVDECTAPTKFTSCMLRAIETSNGKLTPDLVRPALSGLGEQHHAQAKAIYISQVTEVGTAYTPAELKTLCDFAHEHGLYVHMDGARLANACARLGMSLPALSCDCGVDILSLGGTKNGMMMGEAVIAFRPELRPDMKYLRKQSAQLYSKMRYLSAQFVAWFENDLWLKNAQHANDMADLLAGQLQQLPGIRLTQPVDGNSLFLMMPQAAIDKMREHYTFYTWDEMTGEIRLVCSWDTTADDVNRFVEQLKNVL